MEQVFAPKVQGTRVLLSVLAEEPLDFLLLCSSMTAVTGAIGQSDYCAANAYLDALAHRWAGKLPYPVVSVNWDTWRDTGMAAGLRLPPGHGLTSHEATDAFRELAGVIGVPQVWVTRSELAGESSWPRAPQAAEWLPLPAAAAPLRRPRPSLPQAAEPPKANSTPVSRTSGASCWASSRSGCATACLTSEAIPYWPCNCCRGCAHALRSICHRRIFWSNRRLRASPRWWRSDSWRRSSMPNPSDRSRTADVAARRARLTPQQQALLAQRVRGDGPRAPAAQWDSSTGRSGHAAAVVRAATAWFLWRLEPDSTANHVSGGVRLRGPIDEAALRTSLDTLLARHEALRTVFRLTPTGEPEQVVLPAGELALALVDLSGAPEADREGLLWEAAQRLNATPFDLTRGPLLRMTLLRLTPQMHVLLAVMHHIICDGWSMQIVFDEFVAIYRARVQGAVHALAPVALQYPDYALWQRQGLGARASRPGSLPTGAPNWQRAPGVGAPNGPSPVRSRRATERPATRSPFPRS